MKKEWKMDKKNGKIVYVIMTIIFLLSFFGSAVGQDFSANMISTTREGVQQGKVFVAKDKIRIEMMGSVTISRQDKNVMWMLMPQERMYMELPLRPEDIVMTGDKIEGEISRRLIGTEVVDGKKADKYEVIYALQGKNVRSFVWLTQGLNFPIKSAAADGSWMVEYKNMVTGKQPASLFEIPQGYQKFSTQLPDLEIE